MMNGCVTKEEGLWCPACHFDEHVSRAISRAYLCFPISIRIECEIIFSKRKKEVEVCFVFGNNISSNLVSRVFSVFKRAIHSRPHSSFVFLSLLGMRKRRPLGHGIFELIRIFLNGCLEQRIPKRNIIMIIVISFNSVFFIPITIPFFFQSENVFKRMIN